MVRTKLFDGCGCLLSLAGRVRRCLYRLACLFRMTESDWVHSCKASAVVTFSHRMERDLGVGKMSKMVMFLDCCLATKALLVGDFKVRTTLPTQWEGWLAHSRMA